MDFFNLNSEYDQLSEQSKQNILILNNFLNFLKTVNKSLEQVVINSKKSLDILIGSIEKGNSMGNANTTLSSHFLEFYQSVVKHGGNIKMQNTKFSFELIEPGNEFISHVNSKSNSIFSEFKSGIVEAYSQKKKLEGNKSNYFTASKLAEDQEKYVLKTMEDKEKNKGTDKEIEQAHDILYKLRSTAEENSQKYKQELIKTNQTYLEFNQKYIPFIDKMKDLEDSRINFVKFHFEKMNQLGQNSQASSSALINEGSNSTTEIKSEVDLRIFNEKVDTYMSSFSAKSNERIPDEEFVNYDIYRRNLEALIKKNTILLKKEGTAFIGTSQDNFKFPQQSQQFCFSNDELLLIEGLFGKDDINNFQFETLNKKTLTNKTYAKDGIDSLLERYTKHGCVQIFNENNFERLGILLSSVINNEHIQNHLFEINFAIAFIAEKTYYQSDKNVFYKIYLCKNISENNKLIRSKAFWKKGLEVKITAGITAKAKARLKIEIEKEKKKLEEQTGKQSASKQGGSTSSGDNFGGISGSIFKSVINVKNFITGSDKEEEGKQHTDLFKAIYNELEPEEAMNVGKDFIHHFSCFNIDSTDIIDIITETSSKHKFENQQTKIKYIISLINSNMYSLKNTIFYSHKKNGALMKLNLIANSLNVTFPSSSQNRLMNHNYLLKKKIKDKHVLIILNSMKYLQLKDYINGLCGDKKSNKLISKHLFKNILQNEKMVNTTSSVTSTRVKIWKQLLNAPRNIDYASILKMRTKENESGFEIIELDVNRTRFKDDVEGNRKKISNIGAAITLNHPGINYSQGMNYIAAFLGTYTHNEEDAFYIFNSLLTSTDYSDLFTNELRRLNKYFYVFDRLIFLYLPEVFFYLKGQNLSVTYYISPWFITLFTNALNYIKDFNNPKVLVWIFDLFVLDGWKAIIKIGLCLMKHFETKLLGLKYEELLHFGINDLGKYDFFQSNNYDKLKRIYTNLKIESGLLVNIENEFEIKDQLEH